MPSRSLNTFYISAGLAIAAACAFLGLAYFAINSSSSFVPTLLAGLGLATCAAVAVLQFNVAQQWNDLNETLERTRAKLAVEINAGRAKSSFLGKISHELRTPLNAIIGYADVLTQHMFGPIGSPRYDDYAMNIRQGGETLLNIVNDLFEIARANARDGEFTCEPIDAGVVAGKVVAELNPKAADKGLHLKIDVLPRPIWAFGQREALRQVLLRVVGNAIKFTDHGGTIVVNVVPSPNSVHIMVTDNGIGIPQEHLAQLGTAFTQVEDHASRTHGGLGLGLAIARGLVERMDGNLKIESISGRGTRVTIHLRDAEEHAAPKDDMGPGPKEKDYFRATGGQNPFEAAA
ncbi:MAG TPA: HAMP domain-containing sensor histidine kinase [Rhizomicrobium sp.]|nr:HAMP domain-containing sensor histidine kinase [Rhizomicrobium sp.]